MIIKEVDLFKEVSQKVVSEIASAAVEEIYKAGMILFESGQKAHYLYVLEEGSIDIFVGERGGLHFVINKSGDVFGWSSLIEPYIYTASAKCMTDSKVIKVAKDAIEEILRKYPSDGLLMMRHLAGIIAQRLRYAYQNISSEVELHTAPSTPSYG